MAPIVRMGNIDVGIDVCIVHTYVCRRGWQMRPTTFILYVALLENDVRVEREEKAG